MWSLERACWSALSGRGLHPYSLWLATIGLPCLTLFWNLRQDESSLSWLVWISCGSTAAWTIPPETLGRAIVDIGKFRSALADIVPILPSVATKLPKLIHTAYPILPTLLPHMGTVWPHLHLLLPHADFLTRIIPKFSSSRIEEVLPLLEKVGPLFGQLTPAHIAKLELLLDDVLDKLDVIEPYMDQLMPIMADGLLIATPAMLQNIEQVLPHIHALEKDFNWLLPFAEIEGVEELLPYLDIVAPRIQQLQPFAEALAPLMPKIRPHLKELKGNLDVLMDQLNDDVVQNLDPMLYWCGRFLPLANSMGILRSKSLLRAFMPMGKYLPNVPEFPPVRRLHAGSAEGQALGVEWWRHSALDRQVTLVKSKYVGRIVFFEMHVDGRYAGEFRFRHLFELHQSVQAKLPANAPVFPNRTFFTRKLSAAELETRRKELERYLVFFMSSPELCILPEFVLFIRVHRRWSHDRPVLNSPLLN